MNQTHLTDSSRPAPFASNRMANFYRAIGDNIRLDILRILRSDSFGVQELASIFSMAQPGMSHHLKVMANAGLVTSRRQGNSIFYSRTMIRGMDQVGRMLSSVFAEIDTLKVDVEVLNKVKEIHKSRSDRSQSFFDKNAQRFMEKQGLLCELKEYLANMRELLDLANLPKTARVMEVGPGHGEFLRELSGRYLNLVALDNSKEILELAKKQMAHAAEKIEFVRGSLETYQLEGRTPFNAIVLNMVLHHIPSPSYVFQKAGELTPEDGFILIADLAPHNQDWVKESCGDLWLGFDPEELNQWALNAGFHEKQSLYLGLKNGFQIQLKLFQKFWSKNEEN